MMPKPENITEELAACGLGKPKDLPVMKEVFLFARDRTLIHTATILLPLPRSIAFSQWIFVREVMGPFFVEQFDRPATFALGKEPLILRAGDGADDRLKPIIDRGRRSIRHCDKPDLVPTPYRQGGQAFFDGLGLDANPFMTPAAVREWGDGWKSAKAFMDESQGDHQP